MAVIVGTGATEVLSGTLSDDTITGLGGNDTIFGNDGNDNIDGGSGADALIGGRGDDTFAVDDAGDQVFESLNEGTDTVVASISYTLQQGTYVERLNALTGSTAINLVGNELGQTINGNAGNNVLVGNGSAVAATEFDTLVGGLGNDTYLVRLAGDQVVEAASGGTDIVYSDVSYDLATGSEVEALSASTQSSTANLNFTGNEFSQTIVGTFGNNLIRGGGGIDTLVGLAGNDTYVVSQTGAVIAEAAGGGADIVFVTTGVGGTTTYTLNAGAEVETLSVQDQTGTTVHTLKGNEFGQVIVGNAAYSILWGDSDTVAGNGGADTLIGGGGGDDYHVDSLDDVIIESAGSPDDWVFAAGNYAIGAGASIEIFFGEGYGVAPATSDTDGTLNGNSFTSSTVDQFMVGNGLQVQILGTNGANIIDPGAGTAGTLLAGFGGNDTYRVYRQEDRVIEDNNGGTDIIYTSATYSLLVNDAASPPVNIAFQNKNEVEALVAADATATTAINLTGNSLNQFIVGNAGANILNSGGGVDTLVGLGGDDTYVVSNTGTVVTEAAGGGADIVYVAASVTSSYILTDGSYVEALAAIDQGASDAINITGNSFVQTIVGNAGNNILNSGGGADTLIGLAGDDTYRVYGQGEVITEAVMGGTDTVFTSGSYTLTAGAEIETLSTADQSASTTMSLQGNAFSQTVIGDFGNNTLSGATVAGGPADTLIGLAGDDTYRIYNASDVIVEAVGGGNDTAYASVSYTIATGVSVDTLSAADQAGTTDLNFTGNAFSNTLIGNDGINFLDGGLGNDTLIGRGRGDTFMFSTALGATNVDFIQDFASGDRIGLATNIFVGTVATSPNGQLQADQFVSGTAALDANDFIIYNQATGQIFYDADGSGSGAAVLFATVAAGTVLAAADFAPITPAT